MPCLECNNGLWRWGESGKCQYSTKSECDSENADYYDKVDYEFNFTDSMMEELHKEGKLLVNVEKEEENYNILFTYSSADIPVDKSSDGIIASMLDDELDEYIDRLTHSIKKL